MFSPKLLQDFFQFCYVTPDLDAALALYRDRFDVPEFYIELYPTATRTAFAWVGETMIELKQPGDDKWGWLYQDALPEAGLRLHHLAYRVRDAQRWSEVVAGLAAHEIATIPVPTPPEVGLEVLYADTRPQLGHYIEYIWIKSGFPDYFRFVPRAPGLDLHG